MPNQEISQKELKYVKLMEDLKPYAKLAGRS